MLKLLAGLVVGATLLTIGTASAACHGRWETTQLPDTTSCSAQCYVDADNDGVCDNQGTGGCGQNYVDADNDGVCDNQGANNLGGGSMARNCHGKGAGKGAGHHG